MICRINISLLLLLVFFFKQGYTQSPLIGDTVVCEGSNHQYIVGGTANWIYTWSVVNGASSLPTSNPNFVTWGSAGVGTLQVIIDSISGGNYDTLLLSVSIKPKPTPKILADKSYGCTTIDEAGNEIPVSPDCLTTCDSTWVTYETKLNAGSTYQWSINGTVLNTPILTNNTLIIHWGKAGKGNLKVTETNQFGCKKTVETCIEIIKRPEAKFEVSPNSSSIPHFLCLGSEVNFTDKSTGAVKWFWDFGDPASGNNFAHSKNAKHTYNTPGSYFAKLVVENACHCTDTFTYEFDVKPDSANKILCNGVVCADPNSAIEYYTPNLSCSQYHWTVSSNGIITTPGPWSNSIKVIWISGPTGTVSLWSSCFNTNCNDTVSITVQVIPSSIEIHGDKRVCAGEQSNLWVHCMPGAKLNWHSVSPPSKGNPITGNDSLKEQYYDWFALGTDTIELNYFNEVLGCGGTGFTTVEVLSKFNVTGDQYGCLNSSGVYAPSSFSHNFDWFVIDSTGGIISSLSGHVGPYATDPWPYKGNFKIMTVNTSGDFCNDTVEVLVSVYPKPSPIATGGIEGDTLVCAGSTGSYIAFPTNAAYFLEWYAQNGVTSPAHGINPTFKWNPTGPYKVQVVQRYKTAPYCPSDTVELNVAIKAPPASPTVVGNATPCNNSIETYITPDTADGYKWEIFPSNIGSIASVVNTNTITVQFNNDVGSATVRLYLKYCGTTIIKDYAITVGTGPALAVSPAFPQTFCSGNPPTIIATMGGSTAGTYSWFVDGNSVGSGSTLGYGFPKAGTHAVLLQAQAPGCNATQTLTGFVTVNPSPVAAITQQIGTSVCIPDTIIDTLHLSMQSGNSVVWSPSGGTGAGTPTYIPGPIAYGNYSAFVTSSNGCTATSNYIEIGDSCTGNPTCSRDTALIWDSASVVENCGLINLTAHFRGSSIPFSYGWGAGIGNSTTGVETANVAGYHKYNFVYKVATGVDTCFYNDNVMVKVPLIANFDYGIKCIGGGLFNLTFNDRSTFIAPATITLDWKVNGISFSTASNPSVNWTAGATYSVELTISDGTKSCSFTKSVVVPAAPSASFTVAPSGICEGVPVTLTATGTNIASYYWDYGDFSSYKGNAVAIRSYDWTYMGSPARTYTPFLATEGVFGCKDTVSGLVNVYKNKLDSNALDSLIPGSGFLQFCQGQNGVLGVQLFSFISVGGYNYPHTYDWSNGFSQTSSSNISTQTVNQTGNYNVTVTDAYGCIGDFGQIAVAATTVPKPVIYGDHKVCPGSNTWNANVGSSYNYQWTFNGAVVGTNSPALSLSIGGGASTNWLRVQASVSGGGICNQWSDSFKVEVLSPPAKPILSSNPTPACENQAPITLSAIVGPTVVNTNWSNGAVGSPIQVVNKGIYIATAVDSLGCKNTEEIAVHANPDMCYFMCGCYEFCDTISGGVWLPGIPGTYTNYSWMVNGTNVNSGSGIIPSINIMAYGGGEIYLIATNAAGCSDTSCLFEYIILSCDGGGEGPLPCGGDSYGVQVLCEQPYVPGNYNYSLSFGYNWTGCPGAVVSVSSTQGTLTGFTGPLNPGGNVLSGIITFNTASPPSGTICFDFIVTDPCTGLDCKFQICWDVWDCGNLPPGPSEEGSGSRSGSEKGSIPNLEDAQHDFGRANTTELRIYPNPAQSMINVWYQCQHPDCSLEIINNQGTVVRNLDLPNSSAQLLLNKAELAPGSYTFRLSDHSKVLYNKVIVIE